MAKVVLVFEDVKHPETGQPVVDMYPEATPPIAQRTLYEDLTMAQQYAWQAMQMVQQLVAGQGGTPEKFKISEKQGFVDEEKPAHVSMISDKVLN